MDGKERSVWSLLSRLTLEALRWAAGDGLVICQSAVPAEILNRVGVGPITKFDSYICTAFAMVIIVSKCEVSAIVL